MTTFHPSAKNDPTAAHPESPELPPTMPPSIENSHAAPLPSSGTTLGKNSTSASSLKWFYDMPVRRKQMLALIGTEAVALAGVMGVSSWLLISSGRAQLDNQAQSEMVVLDQKYRRKFAQMEQGFRGQADNPTTIEAVQEYAARGAINSDLRTQLRRIYASELTTRNIEYVTLVGRDSKIIVNANKNRAGETFDPGGLVSAVLKNPRQVQGSALVSKSELQKEGVKLPEGFDAPSALIRYVVTPVFDPKTNRPLGAIVAADLAKQEIIEETLLPFKNGYGAVYLRQPDGQFDLVTSMDMGDNPDINQASINTPMPNVDFLQNAVQALETNKVLSRSSVTTRQNVGNQTYTMVAEAVADPQGEPIAVLVRGTSEQPLNQLLKTSLLLQLAVGSVALVLATVLATVLARAISQPVENLQRTAQKFATGDRTARAEVFSNDEVGALAKTFNKMADNVAESEKILRSQFRFQEEATERANLLAEVTLRLRQSMQTDEILQTTVEGIQQIFKADRVLFYRFNPDFKSGVIAAESVSSGWEAAIGQTVKDPLTTEALERYRAGKITIMEDITTAKPSICHYEILEQLQVKATIVVPVLAGEEMLGLLYVHQCSGPRHWSPEETGLLQQIVTQVSYTLAQSILLAQREEAQREAEALSEEQRQQKEAIQMQLLTLLMEVEGATRGDLTVRADVTAGDIGTVADFFNSIVESLRQIVTKVKLSANQVNQSLSANEDAMRRLAEEAIEQAEASTRTLNSVENMTRSIQAVAANAREAAKVARSASMTAEEGGTAMDLTVQNILSLRETVGETAKKVKRLGESSQQISRVVSLINQIAMQTNLLAINAGIEAARAGEEGQGFAVVAEEVGELAARSAAATQEIEKIVEAIQRETSQVVDAMERSTTQVVEGTQLVDGAKRSLNEIQEVSRQIDQLVQSISTATVSQAHTSEAVSKLMRQVAEVSERTSSSSLQVSSALRQTVEVAQELQSSVGTFKIEADA